MGSSEHHKVEDRLRSRIEAYHEAALAYTAVKLALPETMGSKDWAAEQLAAELSVSAPHLDRLLRGLIAIGLVDKREHEPNEEDRYSLSEAGHALARGAASALREKLLIVIEQYWQPWAHLPSTVASGRPAFDTVFGTTVRDWRQANAEGGAVFDAYVACEDARNAGPLLDRLDITGVSTVADLSGGHGGFLEAILLRHPHLRGVLVGPSQTEAANLRSLGAAGRVEFVAGDLEYDMQQVADLYLLKSVLQTYDDAAALKILQNCRKALKPGTRLVIVERLMPDRAADDPAAIMLDLHMMAITGGKVRTLAELDALISGAQLSIAAHTRSDDDLVLIEAINKSP